MKEIKFWDIVKFSMLMSVMYNAVTKTCDLVNKYRPTITIDTKTNTNK